MAVGSRLGRGGAPQRPAGPRLVSAFLGLAAVVLVALILRMTGSPAQGTPPGNSAHSLDIFILAGQSNMVGQGRIDQLPAGFPVQAHHLFSYSNAGRWEPAREPLDSPTGQVDACSQDFTVGVGPGLAMAEALVRLNPGLFVGLVPCARNGSNMDQWQPDPSRQTLYGSCLARAKEARGRGRIRALVWYQGESDAYDREMARAWPAKFLALVRALRRDLGDPGLPVVFTQLAHVKGRWSQGLKGWEELKALQAKISLPGVVMVKTDGLTLEDNVHLDTTSQIKLGQRYALALDRLLYHPGR